MTQVTSMFKESNFKKLQACLIIFLCFAWTIYIYVNGVIISSDAHAAYLPWAESLIKYNFNIFEFLNHVHHRASPAFYSIWVAMIAISKLFLKDHWGAGIVALNLLAGISIATIFIKTSWRITRNIICTFFSAIFFLFCYDFHLWIPFTQPDIIFVLICFSVFSIAVSICLNPTNPQRRILGILVLEFIAFFFRPAWPPLLLFTFLSLPLAFFCNFKKANSNERHSFILKLALFACLIIPVIITVHSHIMLNPEEWPFTFFKDWIYFLANDYRKGYVIYGRLETYHFPPSTNWDYSLITLHKIAAFFYFDIKAYSFKHTLINYMFFIPVYGLSGFAIIQLFKKSNSPSPSNWTSILLCASFIFFFAFFHSLNEIDYDFRYRIPCLLPLILLATLGLNEFLRNFSKGKKMRHSVTIP
jgi:hypothetical protein